MSPTDDKMVQVTVRVPLRVKRELEQLAYFETFRLRERVTWSDLARKGIEQVAKAPRAMICL
jgi:hypothetical protein